MGGYTLSCKYIIAIILPATLFGYIEKSNIYQAMEETLTRHLEIRGRIKK